MLPEESDRVQTKNLKFQLLEIDDNLCQNVSSLISLIK